MQVGVLPQQLKISDAIRIAGENYLSRIPPLRNMMGNVCDNDTRQPSHTKNITELAPPTAVLYFVLCRNSHIGREIIGVRPVCPQVLSEELIRKCLLLTPLGTVRLMRK
jgi:hypothetical protein